MKTSHSFRERERQSQDSKWLQIDVLELPQHHLSTGPASVVEICKADIIDLRKSVANTKLLLDRNKEKNA